MVPDIIPANFINTIVVGRKANSLAHSLIEMLLASRAQVHVIDCAIRLRGYQIAEATRGLDFFALHNITIQRAFTPYQLLDLLTSISASSVKSNQHSRINIFLAPSKQFFDGDVKKDERIHLLKILTQKLERLVQMNIPFVFSESTPKDDATYLQYLVNLQKIGKVIQIPNMITQKNGGIYGQDDHSLLSANPITG